MHKKQACQSLKNRLTTGKNYLTNSHLFVQKLGSELGENLDLTVSFGQLLLTTKKIIFGVKCLCLVLSTIEAFVGVLYGPKVNRTVIGRLRNHFSFLCQRCNKFRALAHVLTTRNQFDKSFFIYFLVSPFC